MRPARTWRAQNALAATDRTGARHRSRYAFENIQRMGGPERTRGPGEKETAPKNPRAPPQTRSGKDAPPRPPQAAGRPGAHAAPPRGPLARRAATAGRPPRRPTPIRRRACAIRRPEFLIRPGACRRGNRAGCPPARGGGPRAGGRVPARHTLQPPRGEGFETRTGLALAESKAAPKGADGRNRRVLAAVLVQR